MLARRWGGRVSLVEYDEQRAYMAGFRGEPRPIDWSNQFCIPFGASRPTTLTAVVSPRRLAYDGDDAVLPPVSANAGVRAAYRKRLQAMVRTMHRSVMKWVTAAYRVNEPLATDAKPKLSKSIHDPKPKPKRLPANEMKKVVDGLKKTWTKKFDEGADRLAKYFAKSVANRTDAQLRKILKDAGISIEFKLTRAQRDVMKAAINESVSLIKSIPDQYFKDVEGSVMRSVAAGRDLSALTKNLERNYGMSYRRAAFIARDQNNKATAMLNRSRQLEVGIDEAIWQHSYAGSSPRKSHVAAGKRGQRYKVSEGWLDPDVGERIWPGTLPNCRCTARSVIAGFR